MIQQPLPNVGRKRPRRERVSKGPPPSPKNYKKVRHVSQEVDRTATGLLERIFAEEWIKENDITASGYGILQELFFERGGEMSVFRRTRCLLAINQRDATVAATVIQWLGTNCGYGFLTKCLRRAGLRLEEDTDVRDRYSYDDERRALIANGWAEHTREFVHPSLRPAHVAAIPRSSEVFRLHRRISEKRPGSILANAFYRDCKDSLERIHQKRLDNFEKAELRRQLANYAAELLSNRREIDYKKARARYGKRVAKPKAR